VVWCGGELHYLLVAVVHMFTVLQYVMCIDDMMMQRIKANQIQKLLHEEKDVLAEQVVTFQHQVESQNLVVRKLEEKERILLSNLATMEKELA